MHTDCAGYCNSVSGQCDIKVLTVAGDCTADPQHSCGDGLDPVIDSRGKCTCQSKNKGSHRPKPDEKSRRSIRLAEALCPRSHTVCHVGSKNGFECVDTQVRRRLPRSLFVSPSMLTLLRNWLSTD